MGAALRVTEGGGKEETYLSYWAEEVKKWTPSIEIMRGSVRQLKAQPLQQREGEENGGYTVESNPEERCMHG